MKRINRTLRLLAVTTVALGSLLSTAPAEAVTVSVTPASRTIGIGDPASVDIVVSGLTDPVGGFSLKLGFSGTLLSGVTFTNDPDGKMGAFDVLNDFSLGFTGGAGSPLDLYYVANASEDEASLAASQGASFTLARVSFSGLAAGLSDLTLSAVDLSYWDGLTLQPGVTTQDGEICVVAAATANGCVRVPEPGTLALLSIGMLGMGLARRRRRN